MPKTIAVRDPIHDFIELSDLEIEILGSPVVQRLRFVHQLALSYLVYPSATHKRFEHSLGVMHLATRIFDVVTREPNLSDDIYGVLPGLRNNADRWREQVRYAALLHDVGHLPFSHAAENLLPNGRDHEHLTRDFITSGHLRSSLAKIDRETPRQVARIATDPKIFPDDPYENYETVLNRIITGKAFGADRMDYLLRDSHHVGVAYGHFDLARLVDQLRLLPMIDQDSKQIRGVELGIREGGLHAAEALLVARYQMFSQIYLHRTRRSFDLLLKDFMREYVKEKYKESGTLPISEHEFLESNDVTIMNAIFEAAANSHKAGHQAALRIVERRPYKAVWSPTPDQVRESAKEGKAVGEELTARLKEQFGENKVLHDSSPPKLTNVDFPVLRRNGDVVQASSLSELLTVLPEPSCEFIFLTDDSLMDTVDTWIRHIDVV